MKTYKIQRPPLTKTFYVPSREDLLDLDIGYLVKLTFTDNRHNNAERMWVQITDMPFNYEWRGILKNKPLALKLKYNEKIFFHPYDIINILPPEHKGRPNKSK